MAAMTTHLAMEARGHEGGRGEIQAAIANAMELRELHATLRRGRIPSLKMSSPRSVSRPFVASHDYPVFAPSYEDEPLPNHHQLMRSSDSHVEGQDEYGVQGANSCKSSSRGYKAALPAMKGSNNFNVASSRNRSRTENTSLELDSETRTSRHSNSGVVPLTDSHSLPRSRGVMSRLFSKLRKPSRTEQSQLRFGSDISHSFKISGLSTVDGLMVELMKANESRDAAVREVVHMKSSMAELRQKLEYLEGYCDELKDALQEESKARNSMDSATLQSFSWSLQSDGNRGENMMPVSDEAMVEGFLQIISEARLSVSQFCRTLVNQVNEKDILLIERLNSLLQPYKLSIASKHPKSVLYHLEAIINQSLYQDFENPIFQRGGATRHLDPKQERRAQFASFVVLRNLSWNQVLQKGTKHYSEEFSDFCDLKMSDIITTLSWTSPWPEQLLQAFFVASKCVWLLHLLAFSFSPPISIMRIAENRCFDSRFMENRFADRQRSQYPCRVKTMIIPGFYIHEMILKSKVICKYSTQL